MTAKNEWQVEMDTSYFVIDSMDREHQKMVDIRFQCKKKKKINSICLNVGLNGRKNGWIGGEAIEWIIQWFMSIIDVRCLSTFLIELLLQ